ncbi:MAG: radical SAM family heme chaperone HemW [Acidobacteriota bacterium]
MKAKGLYVHVPFCASRCSYCSFVTWVDRGEQVASYFDALERELVSHCAGETIDTVFFGGGTPSLPEPARLNAVLSRLRDVAELSDDAELTLEANPESVSPERAEAWRAAGFNRVSVGLQSFDPTVLDKAGRAHDAARGETAVGELRAAGFDSISVDLIIGLPSETDAVFEASVDRALALETEHLSAYLLELDEMGKHSPLSAAVRAGEETVSDDDAVAERYELLGRRCREAGLLDYEISNFARPGHECRHNLKYWRCHETLGLGVGAHWLDGARRRFNVSGFEAYLRAVDAGGEAEDPDSRDAEPTDLLQEKVMLGLRLREGVDLDELADEEAVARFAPVLAPHVETGLLQRDAAGTYRLSDRGRLLSNQVFRDVVAA